MIFDDFESANDGVYEDKNVRRNGPVKRAGSPKRRSVKPVRGSSTPGGIRQRRNKRWSW